MARAPVATPLGDIVCVLEVVFLAAVGGASPAGLGFWATAKAVERTAEMSIRRKRCIVMSDTPETNDGALGL